MPYGDSLLVAAAPPPLSLPRESTRTVSAAAAGAFLVFAVCLVAPIGDIPLLGFSLPALPFLFIVAELVRSSGASWLRQGVWTGAAALFFAAHWLSLAANVWTGQLAAVGAGEISLLIHLAYWLTVFLAVAWIFAHAARPERVAGALGLGIFALGALRLGEGALLGIWGGGRSQLLTQNDYGWCFSTFVPFALWLAGAVAGWTRLAAVFALGLLAVAVAVNGSRTSWVAAGAGLLLFLALSAFARKRAALAAAAAALGALLVSAAAVALAPQPVRDAIRQRSSTFSELDRDKPLLSRQLMIQKAVRLFERSPLWGIGAGRFSEEVVGLDLPAPLRWRPEAYYHRKTPHNAYAKVLAETGLAGLAALAILMGLLGLRAVPAAIRLARQGSTWPLPAAVSLLGMSLHAWTLSGLTSASAWFVFGMAAGVAQRERRLRSAPSTIPAAAQTPNPPALGAARAQRATSSALGWPCQRPGGLKPAAAGGKPFEETSTSGK